MSILRTVRYCDPPDWFIGGGVLYKLVWNRLHGHADTRYVEDVDVVFYEPGDLGSETERTLERNLRTRLPGVPWEVKNQAAIHFRYESKPGRVVPQFGSSEEGIGASPGTATAVGIRLLADNALRIAAPFGLEDLFGLVLRRNPRRIASESFRTWVAEKRIAERWPKVRVIEEPGPVTS